MSSPLVASSQYIVRPKSIRDCALINTHSFHRHHALHINLLVNFIFSFSTVAHPCLEVTGSIGDNQQLQIQIMDGVTGNMQIRCRWDGKMPAANKPQGMQCNSGFAAWFSLNGGTGGTIAYATGNGKVS